MYKVYTELFTCEMSDVTMATTASAAESGNYDVFSEQKTTPDFAFNACVMQQHKQEQDGYDEQVMYCGEINERI